MNPQSGLIWDKEFRFNREQFWIDTLNTAILETTGQKRTPCIISTFKFKFAL